MKLIIILASLGLDRFLNIGAILKRFHWFNVYINWLHHIVKSKMLWTGPYAVALILLPPLLIVGIFYLLLCKLFYGTIGMALSFIVLLYCLGPNEIYSQIKLYFSANEKKDAQESKHVLSYLLTGDVPQDEKSCHRKLTETIFAYTNEGILGVIFWFLILGPIGALLYRLSALLSQAAQTNPSLSSPAHYASMLYDIIDWLPARIVALLFGLAGNLNAIMPVIKRGLKGGLHQSRQLVIDAGLESLGDDANQSIDENKCALALFDRVMIITLVLIAIFTLGAIIY